MMKTRVLALLTLFGLASCAPFDIRDPRGQPLATCYDGAYTAFCVVKTPPGTSLAQGSGVVPAAGMLLLGSGTAVGGSASAAQAIGALKAAHGGL